MSQAPLDDGTLWECPRCGLLETCAEGRESHMCRYFTTTDLHAENAQLRALRDEVTTLDALRLGVIRELEAQLAQAHEPGDCDALARIMQRENESLRAQLVEAEQARHDSQELGMLAMNEAGKLRAHLAQLTAALWHALRCQDPICPTCRDLYAHLVEDRMTSADLPDAPVDLLTEEERPWVEHARGIIRKAIETGHLAEYPPTYTKMLVILDRIAPKPNAR